MALGFTATIFSRVIPKKTAKIVRFTKIRQSVRNTYDVTKDGQRVTVLKLVVPPNLLKQENVCLIPPT